MVFAVRSPGDRQADRGGRTMRLRSSGWGRFALALLAIAAWSAPRSEAQYPDNVVEPPGGEAVRPPSTRGWAEVVTITPKWLVLQNEQGQQLPVPLNDIDLFVIRWPITADRI